MRYTYALLFMVLWGTYAGAATFTIENVDTATHGQAIIHWSADEAVVGMAFEVTADQSIERVQVDPFFDVFLDWAYDKGPAYRYGQGIPTAKKGQRGSLRLPANSFSISVAGFDDFPASSEDDAPTNGTIKLYTPGSVDTTATIAPDVLRGQVVGYNGQIDFVGLDKVSGFVITAPTLCMGDANRDGKANLADVDLLMSLLGASQSRPAQGYEMLDFNLDGQLNLVDVNQFLVLLASTAPAYEILCQ